jgi:hypothetical protein
MPERTAQLNMDRSDGGVAREKATHQIRGKVRRRLELIGIADADDGGDARDLDETLTVRSNALEQQPVEDDDGGALRIEHARHGKRGHAAHLDVLLATRQRQRGKGSTECDYQQWLQGRCGSVRTRDFVRHT